MAGVVDADLLEAYRTGDYLARCRAHDLLMRRLSRGLPAPDLAEHLLNMLEVEEDEEFLLRTLELLAAIGEELVAYRLLPCLRHRNPLVVRGTVLALGEIGGERAAEAIIEFAASPVGRILRREIIAQALGSALTRTEDPQKVLVGLKGRSASYRRYLQGLSLWQQGEKKRFSIYPSADYFRIQAGSRGIDFATYKRAVFRGNSAE